MNKIESRILRWTDEHLSLIFLIACTFLGMAARYAVRGMISVDFKNYLDPWYELISQNGLTEQVGNYNHLYQFLIWTLSKLPLTPLYAYKVLSCAFDFLLAIVGAVIVSKTCEGNKNFWKIDKWAIAYSAIWLCPIVFLNSAGWAQCDAIYATFVLLSLILLERENIRRRFSF